MRGKQAYRTSGTWVDRPEAPFGPLGWEDNGDSYSALLPFIPGYPVGNNTVAVMPASESGDDKLEYDTGWWFMMFIHTNNDGDVLPVSPVDMGIYDTFPTAEDTMQFIEDHLSPESVSQVLEDMDFMPVRDDNGYWLRASRHATRRAASMDLYWTFDDNKDEYFACLPPIPGYTPANPNGDDPNDWAMAYVRPAVVLDGYWTLDIDIADGVYHLNETMLGASGINVDPQALMDFADSLTPEDIVEALEEYGDEPLLESVDASRHVSRKENRHQATRRIASLDLDWERDEEYCRADLYSERH